MSAPKESIGDPFLTHLVALLSVYELGTNAIVLPYTGPSTYYHDSILRSITAITNRMHTAEAKLDDARNTDQDARAPLSDTGLNAKMPAPAASDSSSALPYTGPDLKLPEPVPPAAPSKTSPLDAARDQGVEGSVGELARLQIQVQDVARVCRAVARGDLTQEITVDIEGGVMGELKGSINTIVTKLSRVASEVSRVALEVGTKGILGGEAVVPDVEGTWADLTDSVNVSSRVISLVLAQLTSI
jgi:methyl-accepting chemotaxis protein